jgi:hypothetical protein
VCGAVGGSFGVDADGALADERFVIDGAEGALAWRFVCSWVVWFRVMVCWGRLGLGAMNANMFGGG